MKTKSDRIRELDAREPGLSLTQVAERIGCHPGHVYNVRHPDNHRRVSREWHQRNARLGPCIEGRRNHRWNGGDVCEHCQQSMSG